VSPPTGTPWPPSPTPTINQHPEIPLDDWEKRILAAVITLENLGQPLEFFEYSAWILRNRHESNRFPNNAAGLVFGRGQYDVLPSWFGRYPDVLEWLERYPNDSRFTAHEVAERFHTSVASAYPHQFYEGYHQISIVFGQSNLHNPVLGGLYVGHVDTRVAHLEEQRLTRLGALFGRIDGVNNKSLIWTDHNSGCCYYTYTP
jgi:hypothetical protein